MVREGGGGDTGTERTLSEANCSKKVSSVSGISADNFFLHGGMKLFPNIQISAARY